MLVVLGLIALVLVMLAALYWSVPRIFLLAGHRGYRGPFALIGPYVFVCVMLFGGFRVVVAVGFQSELVVGTVVIAGGLFALAVS
jgi:hypothetical protein